MPVSRTRRCRYRLHSNVPGRSHRSCCPRWYNTPDRLRIFQQCPHDPGIFPFADAARCEALRRGHSSPLRGMRRAVRRSGVQHTRDDRRTAREAQEPQEPVRRASHQPEKRQILPASGAAILRREILKLNRKSRLAEDIASPSGRLSYHLSAAVNIPRGQFGADLCIQLVTNLKLTCDEFATISASRSPNVWQNAG